ALGALAPDPLALRPLALFVPRARALLMPVAPGREERDAEPDTPVHAQSSPSRSAIHAPASAQTSSPSTFIHSASPSLVQSQVGSPRCGPIWSCTPSLGCTVTSRGGSHVSTSRNWSEVCRAHSPLHAPSARATCSTCTVRGRSLRLVTKTVRDS